MKARVTNIRAAKTSDHSLSDRVTGQMALETLTRLNPAGAYSFSGTTDTATVNWAGFYLVNVNIHFPNPPNAWEWTGVGIRINGVQDSWCVGNHGVDSTNTRVNATNFYNLNKGDIIDIVRYQAQNPGAALTGSCSFCWIDLVRLDRF